MLAQNRPVKLLSGEGYGMRPVGWLAVGLMTGGALGGGPSTAMADTPPHSCDGQIIAAINQASGVFGASGNPQAGAGPGYFLGTNTANAIADVRETFCAYY